MRREINGEVNDDAGKQNCVESGKGITRKGGNVDEEANQAPRPEKKRDWDEELQSKNAKRIEESRENRHRISAGSVRHVIHIAMQSLEKAEVAEVGVVAPIVCPVAEVQSEIRKQSQADEKNCEGDI